MLGSRRQRVAEVHQQPLSAGIFSQLDTRWQQRHCNLVLCWSQKLSGDMIHRSNAGVYKRQIPYNVSTGWLSYFHDRYCEIHTHHGDQTTTMWERKSTDLGMNNNDEARGHTHTRTETHTQQRTHMHSHTHSPMGDSTIIDWVVDINRKRRQVHLFSRWSVVRHKTVWKPIEIISHLHNFTQFFWIVWKINIMHISGAG